MFFSAALQPRGSGKGRSCFSESQIQCKSWGRSKQPAAPVRGTVNRAELVPAVARGMKKAEHGRRKKRLWLTVIVLSVHIWGI